MCAGDRTAVPHWAALIPGQFHRCFLPCQHAKEVINPGIRSLEKSLLVCAGQIVGGHLLHHICEAKLRDTATSTFSNRTITGTRCLIVPCRGFKAQYLALVGIRPGHLRSCTSDDFPIRLRCDGEVSPGHDALLSATAAKRSSTSCSTLVKVQGRSLPSKWPRSPLPRSLSNPTNLCPP